MVDIKTLLPELKKLVTELSEDLLARSTGTAEIDAGLREAYTQIEKGGRTAQAFEVWREDYLDQVAVAWVLSCVFVRFMEDNQLIDDCWLAGEGDRRKQSEDAHELYFRKYPHNSDREYFEHVFHEVGTIPACKDLFAEGKTPLWAVGPSGDAAMKLLAFWRDVDTESGHLRRTFDVKDGDTRFLGDLYQHLSENARKKYALLQTPVFVEEFILDRTLDLAIDEFGLDEVRMIDPTCGSGHFLLGGFARLFNIWSKPSHTTGNAEKDAQNALDGVWGVDVNPFAVAIARFRLIVAAVQACEIQLLKLAPAWNIHLATGDSLLFGDRWDREGKKKGEQQFLGTEEESWAPEIYACEDKNAISEVLGQQYHAVVGNPPYITVKDKALSSAYRDQYATCYREYSLVVPFMERFFDLAINEKDQPAGFIGVIGANSFMKREFGKRLVESFFKRIDLTHVVDTSVAHIPGHGTPTVIVFGRNRSPIGNKVHAVLGIKGEPFTPVDPANGLVWRSIVKHMTLGNSEDEFTSSSELQRDRFYVHPWSLKGGGATELLSLIENGVERRLKSMASAIGFICMTRADDVYFVDRRSLLRRRIPESQIKVNVEGDTVRDWSILNPNTALFPYDSELNPIPEDCQSPAIKFLWPYRSLLWLRREPNGNHKEIGLTWYEWSRLQKKRLRKSKLICFACIATHNHFVFSKAPFAFKQSAPVIQLKEDNDDTYIGILGLLNSSVGCFWIHQTCHNKGGPGGAASKDEKWHDFYDLSAAAIGKFPVWSSYPLSKAKQLVALGERVSSLQPQNVVANGLAIASTLETARAEHEGVLRQMVSLQEELDWECYGISGVCDALATFDSPPEINPGERAFEIVLAQHLESGSTNTKWFSDLGIAPVTEIPDHWPEDYKKVVSQRIALIRSSKQLRLLECPDCKRRWAGSSWDDLVSNTLAQWLKQRLEDHWGGFDAASPALLSSSELAHKASGDSEFASAAAIFMKRDDYDLEELVANLVAEESVPLLPSLYLKPQGQRKYGQWESCWGQQRIEDQEAISANIDPPPQFGSADFQRPRHYRIRGKLNVRTETYFSLPFCERDGDKSLVVGWAGWDHVQQATAIVAYYDSCKRDGWTSERLTPLLAGLDQLLPWIHQWHPEIDPEYNETAGTSFQTLLESEAQELGLTLEQIRSWTPPAKKKATKKKAAKKPRKKAKSAEATEGE